MYEFHITSSESADEGLSLLKITNAASTATATSLVVFALAECIGFSLFGKVWSQYETITKAHTHKHTNRYVA